MKNRMIGLVMLVMVLLVAGPMPAQAAYNSDIVFVIDQSGSMGGEFAWLGNSITGINTALIAGGVTANYGVAGYETSAGFVDSRNAWLNLPSTAAQVTTEVNSVSTYGGTERGYQAADWAANNFSWTGGNYAKVMILITDEDADGGSSYAYGGLFGEAALAKKMADDAILFNVITLQSLYSVWDSAVYTKGAYQGLFDLDYLRTNPTAFTNDFVQAKMQEIIISTPEPGTMFLLGLGLIGVAAWRRRK